MKNLFFLILILNLINIKTEAQTYQYVSIPTENAIWSEVYYYGEPVYPDTIIKFPSYERFAVNGEDTILNNKTYHKIFMFTDTVFSENNSIYVGGIREDNKKIYFTADSIIHEGKPCYTNAELNNGEILLYDFNLNIGDTFPTNGFIVTNIDTILINGNLRKKIIFNTREWIEGIGDTYGLLFIQDIPTGSFSGSLICFKQNNEIVYFNNSYNECMPLYTDKITKNNSLTVFPNPTNEKLFINSNEIIKEIKIYNVSGGIVRNYKTRSNNISITLNLNKGIYFVKIIGNNENIITKKIIIN